MMDDQRLEQWARKLLSWHEDEVCIGDCTTADRLRDVLAVVAEVRRLREHNHELAEMLAGRTTVEAFTAKHGMFDLTIGGMGAQIIAQSMIQLFKTGGATNFLTFKAVTLEGDYSFTIQKATGITPEEKYAQMCVTLSEAESALTSARAALQAVEWVRESEHVDTQRDTDECPWCKGRNLFGHARDCQRQAALGLTPDREGR